MWAPSRNVAGGGGAKGNCVRVRTAELLLKTKGQVPAEPVEVR